MWPICVSEPMGCARPLRMAMTPAMVVVLTAPSPTRRIPSFPSAGAISEACFTLEIYHSTAGGRGPLSLTDDVPAADAHETKPGRLHGSAAGVDDRRAHGRAVPADRLLGQGAAGGTCIESRIERHRRRRRTRRRRREAGGNNRAEGRRADRDH